MSKPSIHSIAPLPSPPPRTREGGRRAFTLLELLAVLIIVLLLFATFVPYAMSLRESSNRMRCAANLANINRALRDYAAANGYFYPRVRFDPAMGNTWTAFTGPDDSNPFANDSAVSPNDVTASLWLLVREGLAQPDWFVCPSGGGRADRIVDAAGEQTVGKKRANFRTRDNLGYGYATPFSSILEYRLNDTLPARFALLADRPPSESAIEKAANDGLRFDANPKSFGRINSPNHSGAGENVLYADGSVNFELSPYCGVRPPAPDGEKWIDKLNGDNIYTGLATTPLINTQPAANEPGVIGQGVGPAYRYDSVLVPGNDFLRNLRAVGQALANNAIKEHERSTPLPASLPATRSSAASQP